MKLWSRCLLLVFSLLAAPTLASADPCGVTTVDRLIGQTCDIGALRFTFANFLSVHSMDPSTALTASQVTLTPDASDLLNPRLTLSSAAFHVGGIFENYDFANENLYFSVSVVTGEPLLNGLSAELNGAFLTTWGSQAAAGNNVWECMRVMLIQEGFQGTIYTRYTYADGPQSCAPVSGGSGYFDLYRGAGSYLFSASYDSATFGFSLERAPQSTPEPATFILLGSGLVGVIGAIRRRM